MQPREIISTKEFHLIIKRLAHQLVENHGDFSDSVLIGLQDRGVYLADKLGELLQKMQPKAKIHVGHLDITFFRDDFRRSEKPLVANQTLIDFVIENKKVILIDDVLYTGRSVRAAIDALMPFGRPRSIELLVLIDRRLSRHLPIQPNYVGKVIDSIDSERVVVSIDEIDGNDKILILKP